MKVCIDPGHGFANTKPGVYDSGATSNGVAEADICLSWALTIKWVFANAGIEVFLTRDSDKTPDPVGKRDDKAVAAGCTHFIALHCNSAGMLASGTETMYRDFIDKLWAKEVHAITLQAMKSKDRGVKIESMSQHPRLAVLDFPGPACLVELGFITNSGDRTKLLSRDIRIAFATKLLNLVQHYHD